MTAVADRDSPRLAVLGDFLEEGWPSMDLVAEMLLAQLSSRHAGRLRVQCIRPPFRRHLAPLWYCLPGLGKRGRRHNLDRLLNRYWGFPWFLRSRTSRFDLFHVCDHSYSQLVHALPTERTGVFCHDLDTFRCLLEPESEPRPRWFKLMARRTLSGMQKAAVVFYTTDTVRRQIERHGLLDPSKLVKAPLGIAPEFAPQPQPTRGLLEVTARLSPSPFLLHVGSCIPRKRIDVLLAVFAAARQARRDLQFIQIGGAWTSDQLDLMVRLGIERSVRQVRGLPRACVAEPFDGQPYRVQVDVAKSRIKH